MSDLSQRLKDALADRYRIERELGRGGMATVFLAEDLKHGRRVAIKVLDPEVAATIGPPRFLREIETVARLTHPHILPLHDSGVAGGSLYYVMPYVAGESLRARLSREKQLPLEDALRIAREVADALGYAHERGVVHRDIKPENILLESGHAVVADFGIARAADPAGGATLTSTGMTLGTPAYMSPEQAAGSHVVDGRSDEYALGCVLYEMLAGVPPFVAPTAENLAYQHLSVIARPVTELRPTVPGPVAVALAKALAKAPADRYATAAEFAAAIVAVAEPPTGPMPASVVPRVSPARHRVRAAALVLGVAVVALVAVAAWQEWWPFGGPSGPLPTKKDWILVAEFDGPPGDSTLAPAARSLLSAALDQSRLVATVPQDQIRVALEAAGKPKNTRVDAELAKELACRSAVRAVLEGTIGRIGKGYSIVLRVVDADTSRLLVTEQVTAKDEDALIPALGRVAKRLRAGLGENRSALRATRSMALVATPSFEAYKLYLQAGIMYRRQTSNRKAIALYRAALDIDPDFATAWTALVAMYANLGYPDSQLVCIEEALRRPDRLSAGQRSYLARTRAGLEGNFAGVAAAYDQMVADDPANAGALAGSWDPLMNVGRYEEATERTRRAMKLRPFGPVEADRINLAVGLALTGHFDEAREANSHQTGIFRDGIRINLETIACRFAVAESIAALREDDPQENAEYPGGTSMKLASIHFARGALRASAAALARADEAARAASSTLYLEEISRARVEYASLTDGRFPLPPDTWARDTSLTGLISRGLRATCVGDLPVARRCLAAVRARPPRSLVWQGAGPALLESRVALMQGNPREAVRLLRPWSLLRTETGWPPLGVFLVPVRWAMADAFERLAQPDSAAAHLERNVTVAVDETPCWPIVHRRLALLYARMGRVADAERHLAALEKLWDRPDPDVRRMLDEARTAVRSGRGMARPVGGRR